MSEMCVKEKSGNVEKRISIIAKLSQGNEIIEALSPVIAFAS